MPGEHDPRRAPEIRAREHGVAVADDLQMRRLPGQSVLHGVGEFGFRTGDTEDVDQRGGQVDGVGVQVEGHARHRTRSG